VDLRPASSKGRPLVAERYGEQRETEPQRLHAEGFSETRSGGVGLLRDLHELYVFAGYVDTTWTVVGQVAKGARDQELIDVVEGCEQETTGQLAWLRTRMKTAAPLAPLVAE